jgi:hypothetical protein
MGVATPPDNNWDAARAQARSEVHSLLAPGERVCSSCGFKSRAGSRTCPACGEPYVVRRKKLLGTRRAKLIAGLVVAAALGLAGGLVALLAPGIEHAKHYNVAALERQQAATRAVQTRIQAEQQKVHTAAVPARGRQQLVMALQGKVMADALARVRAKTLAGPVLRVSCAEYPPSPVRQSGRFGAYSCLAVTRDIKSSGRTVGALGEPFFGRIDTANGRLAWCRIYPLPGETAIGSEAASVPLAPVCDLKRPAPAGF